MNENIFTLPGGYFHDGCLHKDVQLKPITGKDEEMLAEAEGAGEEFIITLILANCIQCLGHLDAISIDIARKMLIADRDFILMKQYQLTFGDKVDAILTCPACDKKMDIDFFLSEVEVAENNLSSQVFTMELSSLAAYEDEQGRKHRNIEFRLPNGGDLEAVEGIKNEIDAVIKLLSRCVIRVGDKRMDENISRSLTALARREIEEEMSELAPRVELEMDIKCPECQHLFTTHFNIGLFFSKISG
jgi:uncharacterized protein (UPF0212 family)